MGFPLRLKVISTSAGHRRVVSLPTTAQLVLMAFGDLVAVKLVVVGMVKRNLTYWEAKERHSDNHLSSFHRAVVVGDYHGRSSVTHCAVASNGVCARGPQRGEELTLHLQSGYVSIHEAETVALVTDTTT
uniref:Uncharacterized protein n=1 Tax=Compsopogon caeruleus TaxID=31354 RepID=A0A7S1TCZ6_9RHOD|mmetsp:Transcript_18082/g.37539  ORF Transcript_18082/g.37539 Transcript_18082/m.37539 type:complete len:130 (+) Transcript_18082:960-1349(+)